MSQASHMSAFGCLHRVGRKNAGRVPTIIRRPLSSMQRSGSARSSAAANRRLRPLCCTACKTISWSRSHPAEHIEHISGSLRTGPQSSITGLLHPQVVTQEFQDLPRLSQGGLHDRQVDLPQLRGLSAVFGVVKIPLVLSRFLTCRMRQKRLLDGKHLCLICFTLSV